MNIAIIDADLIGKNKHRFPNLVCMKESGYYKELGHNVKLLTNYENLESYDLVLISKVFTDTPIDDAILNLSNVKYGGTGFYYDKAPKLDCEIEHHMPDYNLYNEWVNEQIDNGVNKSEFAYYLDYSIGFTTRGCFRQCAFCVNKNYKKVEQHSPLSEFLDEDRKYICLLDDNILGYPKWKEIFEELKATNKPFQYKQGMDERILTDEKCKMLSEVKYKGDFIFAFDNIEDREIIETKLTLLRQYIDKRCKFYVFCGFDRNDKWDYDFWVRDILETFERIKILMKYGAVPYIMRFNRYEESPYRGLYINFASWCNQPAFFKKMSFREFCIKKGINSKVYSKYKNDYDTYLQDGYSKGSSWRYLDDFESKHSDISEQYFDIKFNDINEYIGVK